MDQEQPATARVFQLTNAERQKVAKCLRYIDRGKTRARASEPRRQSRNNIRELQASADQIFDLISGLEETIQLTPETE